MINAWFGIDKNPFGLDSIALLPQQQDVFDTLRVHSQQGGLCLLMGEPGTGKSVIKEAIRQTADKRTVVVCINRTMHTYSNTLKILCDAFQLDHEGMHVRCERRLIEQAFKLNREGKALITVIDEAHLLDIDVLRKLRLMFDEFPKNHNLILVGQTSLLAAMCLTVNADLKSRITYSTTLLRLAPDDLERFLLAQFDAAGLGHNTFSDEALGLVVRSSDLLSASGRRPAVLRRSRNLSLSCLLETVRARVKTVSLDIVNRVLIQPHWRNDFDLEAP